MLCCYCYLINIFHSEDKTTAKANSKKKRFVIYPFLHGFSGTLEYDAMQYNAMHWHSAALEKTLCPARFPHISFVYNLHTVQRVSFLKF